MQRRYTKRPGAPITILRLISPRSKMAWCGVYYAGKGCLGLLAGRAVRVWPTAKWDVPAVLCGVCGYKLTIREYMDSGSVCPRCKAGFNPGYSSHSKFYCAAEEKCRRIRGCRPCNTARSLVEFCEPIAPSDQPCSSSLLPDQTCGIRPKRASRS